MAFNPFDLVGTARDLFGGFGKSNNPVDRWDPANSGYDGWGYDWAFKAGGPAFDGPGGPGSPGGDPGTGGGGGSTVPDWLRDLMAGMTGGGGSSVHWGGSQQSLFGTPQATDFIKPLEFTDKERQARLVAALGGVRGGLDAVNDVARTSAARAGIAPGSGVAQQVVRDLLNENQSASAGVKRDAYLAEEMARRQREDLIGQLQAQLTGQTMGANAQIKAANANSAMGYAQMNFNQQMVQYQQMQALINMFAAMGIDFPSLGNGGSTPT